LLAPAVLGLVLGFFLGGFVCRFLGFRLGLAGFLVFFRLGFAFLAAENGSRVGVLFLFFFSFFVFRFFLGRLVLRFFRFDLCPWFYFGLRAGS
jgi:hypothetical protein